MKKKMRRTVNVIFDDDLTNLIRKHLNVEDPTTETYRCKECKRSITFNEIGAIKIENGKLYFICTECL